MSEKRPSNRATWIGGLAALVVICLLAYQSARVNLKWQQEQECKTCIQVAEQGAPMDDKFQTVRAELPLLSDHALLCCDAQRRNAALAALVQIEQEHKRMQVALRQVKSLTTQQESSPKTVQVVGVIVGKLVDAALRGMPEEVPPVTEPVFQQIIKDLGVEP